jgi:4-hydroxy-tetrahydrodipicolinate synthase
MFTGSLVALVTPMTGDGRVDFDSLRQLVDFHVREGTDAIISVGTTGESATLDFKEHLEVIERTVEFAAGRIPVIAGTGANATREAIELTRQAKGAGVQACLLVTPYYNKPTQEGLYRHYRAVAEAVDIPQILYNVPGRTGCDMLPATVERLAGTANIVGLKEAKGELPRIQELLDRVAGQMSIYSGDDATACESILMGCKGDISVTANVAPRLMHEMCVAAQAGDRARALELDAKLQPLHKNLFLEPNPIPVKWALLQMKLIPEGIRLPLTPLDVQYHAPLREALAGAGVLA